MAQKQSICYLCKWILEKDPGNIAISVFDKYVIENQYEALKANRETRPKTGSSKRHDKPPIWDSNIFLKKLHIWLRWKNNSMGVSLTWITILKDNMSYLVRKPIEIPSFLRNHGWSYIKHRCLNILGNGLMTAVCQVRNKIWIPRIFTTTC